MSQDGNERDGKQQPNESLIGMARELVATVGDAMGQDPDELRGEFDRVVDSATREGVSLDDLDRDITAAVQRRASVEPQSDSAPWPWTTQPIPDEPGQLLVVDHPHDRVDVYRNDDVVLVQSDVGNETIEFANEIGSVAWASNPGDDISEIIIEPPRLELQVDSETTVVDEADQEDVDEAVDGVDVTTAEDKLAEGDDDDGDGGDGDSDEDED